MEWLEIEFIPFAPSKKHWWVYGLFFDPDIFFESDNRYYVVKTNLRLLNSLNFANGRTIRVSYGNDFSNRRSSREY